MIDCGPEDTGYFLSEPRSDVFTLPRLEERRIRRGTADQLGKLSTGKVGLVAKGFEAMGERHGYQSKHTPTDVVKPPRSISSLPPTKVIAVASKEESWKFPPPPGLWTEIDRARIDLRWSKSRLSREADLHRSHYGNIGGTRDNWSKVQGDTQQKLIRALVEKGGIPEERFSGAAATAPGATSATDVLAMMDKAARMYAEANRISGDEAWLLIRDVRPVETSVAGFLAAMMASSDRAHPPERAAAERRASKPPTPTKQRRGPGRLPAST